MTTLPDHQLVLLARDGHHEAAAVLYQRHQHFLLTQSRTYAGGDVEPEDLVQETWLRILGELRHFRPQKSFRAWAVTVLRNLGRDTAAMRSRRRRLLEEHHHDIADRDTEPPHFDVSEEADRRLVYELLTPLSTRQRLALLLHVGERCPSQEVSRTMGCRPPTVRTTCHFALERIRRGLRGHIPPRAG